MKCTMIGNSAKVWCAAMLVSTLAVGSVLAADAAPAKPDAEAKNKALEERVRVLEKRIAEMEANEANAAKGLSNARPRQNFQQDDFNKMFEQMRRQMLENGNAFGMDPMIPMPPMPGMPPMQGMPGMPGPGMHHTRKPSLGVGIDEVSDELKTRFKNEVKEGVFVLNIYPNSAAEKAGIVVGDAITSFDGKAVANPRALIDAVKTASKGSHELTVTRHGELLKLKVDLTPSEVSMNEGLLQPGPNDTGMETKTTLHVSALEIDDTLAKELGLNADQQKKMGDVLAAHAKSLSTEFSKANPMNAPVFSLHGDLDGIVKKHVDEAAKDLVGVLSADQLKKWNDYVDTHSSISFSQSTQMGNLQMDPHSFRPSRPQAQDEETETIKF